MRPFKKKIVSAALRKSPFLIVSEDGKKVSRKVPLIGPHALDPDYMDDEIAYDPRGKKPVVKPIVPLPQEKKNYPPGMTKNMMKPTGFEKNFVGCPFPQVAVCRYSDCIVDRGTYHAC